GDTGRYRGTRSHRKIERRACFVGKNRRRPRGIRRSEVLLRILRRRDRANARRVRAHRTARLEQGATLAQPLHERRRRSTDRTMSAANLDLETWHRVSYLLDRALDLELAERDSWLDDLNATEPQVASTLRKLLRSRGLETTDFLEGSAGIAGKLQLAAPCSEKQ